MNKVAFNNMSDDNIIFSIREGSFGALDYLLDKYKYLAKRIAGNYFLKGAEREDIIQEAMIGLFKAIKEYDIDNLASFKSFASTCIKNQCLSAIESANRQKHAPLYNYKSIQPQTNEENGVFFDLEDKSGKNDPETIAMHKESMRLVNEEIEKTLSSIESTVLKFYIEGLSYEEISKKINRPKKTVDNALQRIKRKLKKLETSLII